MWLAGAVGELVLSCGLCCRLVLLCSIEPLFGWRSLSIESVTVVTGVFKRRCGGESRSRRTGSPAFDP